MGINQLESLFGAFNGTHLYRMWSQFWYSSAGSSIIEAGVTFLNLQLYTLLQNMKSVLVSISRRQCCRGWSHFLEHSDEHTGTKSGVRLGINQLESLFGAFNGTHLYRKWSQFWYPSAGNSVMEAAVNSLNLQLYTLLQILKSVLVSII